MLYFEEGDRFWADSDAACAFATCGFDADWSRKPH